MLFREAVIIDLRRVQKKKIRILSEQSAKLFNFNQVNTYLPLGTTRTSFLFKCNFG
jgi:hypothetical protein